MQTFGAFLVSYLAATGLAAAIPPRVGTTVAGKETFSVTAARNPAFRPSGPLALAKAHVKFGKPVPTGLAALLAGLLDKRAGNSTGSGTGSVAAEPQDSDSEYLCPVQIGTPAQTVNLDFDTGSSDLWVFSSDTSGSNGQKLYKPSSSSSSKKLSGATWSITYGDGSASSGIVYTDTVTVGGLTVTGQAIESAQKVSSQFVQDTASSGLLGLAFSELNTVKPKQQLTFFDNAKNLGQKVFTADLRHNSNGLYNFGYIDDSAHTGTIAYVDVDSSQGFWGFTATVDGDDVPGIADTGTTLLLLPDTVVKSYYSKVKGAKLDSSQGGYTFSCSATLPDFEFAVGDNTITVPGDFVNFAPVDSSGSSCFGGIQSDSDIGFSIFGDVALKAAFVVFDGEKKQLG